ncbi:MAG: hypothetical protein FJ303_15725 [Planctomycetes bacterium]|nr:hypothetical protein [Planctomycetota bacterium]
MPQTQFILNEVAKIAGVKPHAITYAITAGHIPEPPLRIAGKRIFSAKEVESIKTYFENRTKKESDDK